jgi:hypothetical protein
MSCKTKEDFNSAIEFGKIINDTRKGQTAETTVQFLDLTQQNVAKIDGKYTAGTATIKESVTEKVNRKKPYTGKANPLLGQQGEIGNHIHDLSEFLTQSILDVTNSRSNEAAYKYVKELASFDVEGLKKINQTYGRQLDAKAARVLFEGVKQTLLSIYKVQRAINALTNNQGKVEIRLEQVLIDPKNAIGGTADLVAIFSDNTAAIVDYKTKILKKKNQDAFGKILDASKVVYASDVEKYKLQTGEYGRILRQSYGVESIRSVTVLPIALTIDLDTNLAKYGNTIKSIKFPGLDPLTEGYDPLLKEVLPFSNKTGFKELDDYIRNIDDRIKKLEQRIKNDHSLRDSLQPRIDQLTKAKTDIMIDHNLDTLLTYGKSLSDKVVKGELNQLSIQELMDLLNELQLLENLTSATHSYRNFLKEHGNQPLADTLQQKIGGMVSEIQDKIETLKEVLYKDKVVHLIEELSGFNMTDEYGNYIPLAQEGYFGKWFYQLSQYDNPVFKSLKKILQRINYEVRQKTDKVTEEIQKTESAVDRWLKSTGRSPEDLVKIMINPTTDNFWGKYTGEYIDTIKLANGATMYQYYDPTERYQDRYMDRLFAAKERFEKEEKLEGKQLEYAINNWISQNDLSLDQSGKPLHTDAWENARRFNWIQMKDNPAEYNKNYQFILSVPELKAYYEMFEKYNKEFRELLGVNYNQLPNNFLPNVRKVMSERITEQGVNGFISGTQDFFKDFSIREEERSADSTYNSNDQIPIFFLNRFRSTDGELQVGEKSYQFGRSLQIFAKMAYNYEASTEREAEILALQQFLTHESEQISQSRGKNMIDQMGNTITEKLQANELPEIFKSYVDMYIYKINVKPVIGDKSGRTERMLLKAKEYFTLKVLGFNVIAGLGSLVSAKINAMIEANKGIIYSKENYQDALKSSWTDRERFLAMNAYFDPMQHRLNHPVLSGEKKYGERHYADPTMKGWINKYVNSRMLMNTFSIGDEYIEELITVAMSKHYYLDENYNVRRIANDSQMEQFKDRLIYNLFSYDRENGAKLNVPEDKIADVYENFRSAIQAGQSRIKGTIPEEDKAAWQNNIFGQLVMHFKSWMPGIMFERFGKVKFDSRIDSIYMGKFTALGKEFQNPDKLVFGDFMKKILLPKLGKLVADIATLGMMSKSRLNDRLNKELYFQKWLDENPHLKGKVSFEEFNEVQQKQLKSVIQELRVLLLLAGLILLMGGDWDDDGEKDYKKYLLTRKLASLLFKTQQEQSFVYSPVAFASMIKSPLPMLGLVTDGYKTITNTFGEFYDLLSGKDALIGLGKEGNDKTPRLSKTLPWIPGVGGVMKFLETMNNDVQYETNQY